MSLNLRSSYIRNLLYGIDYEVHITCGHILMYRKQERAGVYLVRLWKGDFTETLCPEGLPSYTPPWAGFYPIILKGKSYVVPQPYTGGKHPKGYGYYPGSRKRCLYV